MRLRNLPRAAALAAVSLVTAACFAGSSGGGAGAPQDDPGPGRGSRSAPDQGEFKKDINDAVTVAETYWDRKFREDFGERFRPVSRIFPYTRQGEVACGNQPLPLRNAAYCSDGDFIAYDINWSISAFQQVGDAFLWYLLGHEYAHGVQVRLGVQYRYTIEQELQADCMAGAYLGESIKAGDIELEDGDIDELRQGLLAVGDDPNVPWFTPGAHGTAKQRTDAFFTGYQQTLKACKLG